MDDQRMRAIEVNLGSTHRKVYSAIDAYTDLGLLKLGFRVSN